MKTLDMLGQPCPIPVVKAKEVLAEQGAPGVVVLVDNMVAVQNLEKMAKGTGCGFSYVEEGASYRVSIVKGAASDQGFAPPSCEESPSGQAKVSNAVGEVRKGPVVLITSDNMGRGSEELGRMLIKGFIFSLSQLNPLPEAVLFLNGGARLTTEGANTVPDLKMLEEKGTGIYTCGTCANYYKLTESLAVGSIVDMMQIVNRLAKATVVITV
ncbi:MAG: sulfurtransferase-like selenium metabolism protein YedF [Treponema sp.]|jgi:selenium metabolism protein YedF|nr:sulfurtransferase-like selenium metabolism protein YedF [Treponema sp.]